MKQAVLTISLLLSLLFILAPECAAESQLEADAAILSKERVWVGQNGRILRGKFVRLHRDDIYIRIKGGKIVRVSILNLSDKTWKWFDRAWKAKRKLEEERKKRTKNGTVVEPKPLPKVTPKNTIKLQAGKIIHLNYFPDVDTSGFKSIPPEKATRLNLPNYNQSDYGKKASDCVPNSYAMFVAWWHINKWINVPGRERNFSDKVDWIHKRLARHMGTRNNSGTDNRKNIRGLQKFFSDEVKAHAAFTMEQIVDYRPENLAKHTKGANCTVLMLTIYYGRKNEGGHAVALKRVHPDGTLEFNTWGCSLKGKLKVLPGEKVKAHSVGPRKFVGGKEVISKLMLPRYEIEISTPSDLPDWFKNNDGRFILDASEYDQLMVLTPYIPSSPVVPGDGG